MSDVDTLDGWLRYIDAVHPSEIEMGLTRTRTVADRLDVLSPAPCCVVIAGTNGKGSTAVALERLLLNQDLKVGTTLSPHVEVFNERLRIDGQELSDRQICGLLRQVDDARQGTVLTYFEYSALAALLAFKQAAVDVAILEIGLGGRLDAFNVVDADLAIVTSIGLDHQDYLGSDVETIGREKAGIFRAGQTAVIGSEVSRSVEEVAEQLECEVFKAERDFQIGETSRSFSYRSSALALQFDLIDRGALAPANCGLAITAAALLQRSHSTATGLDAQCLADVSLTGRMEVHHYHGSEVILDVAHNPAAAGFLARQLEQREPGRRYVGILGSLDGKDARGVIAELEQPVRHWLTLSTHGFRARSAEDLALATDLPAESAHSDIAAALASGLSLKEPGDGIVVIGSFSAVEQARTLLIECSEKCGKLETDG